MNQGVYLQKLSDCLEGSRQKVITKLPVGSTLIANNYFWLHGRRPFERESSIESRVAKN